MDDFKFLYLCDRKACENCNKKCQHTSDIKHAVNRDCFDGCMFQFSEHENETYFIEVE